MSVPSWSGPVKKVSDLDRLREDELVDFLKDRDVPIAGIKGHHQFLRLAKSEFRSDGFLVV